MKFVVILVGVLVILCSLVYSEWEDRDTQIEDLQFWEKTVYDTTQFVKQNYWLDQADRDSVQVIFEEEYLTRVEVSGLGMITDQSPHFDSVFYDTIRYYRR